jgi:hypothetical protein
VLDTTIINAHSYYWHIFQTFHTTFKRRPPALKRFIQTNNMIATASTLETPQQASKQGYTSTRQYFLGSAETGNHAFARTPIREPLPLIDRVPPRKSTELGFRLAILWGSDDSPTVFAFPWRFQCSKPTLEQRYVIKPWSPIFRILAVGKSDWSTG